MQKGRLRVAEPAAFIPSISTAAAIRAMLRQNAIDPWLQPIDRHMQRWAESQGAGLPNPDRALMLRSKLPPLPAEEAIATDQVVLSTPRPWRIIVKLWYRSDCSVQQICEDLGIGRSVLYCERKVALAYLAGRMVGVGIRLDPALMPLTASVQTA